MFGINCPSVIPASSTVWRKPLQMNASAAGPAFPAEDAGTWLKSQKLETGML